MKMISWFSMISKFICSVTTRCHQILHNELLISLQNFLSDGDDDGLASDNSKSLICLLTIYLCDFVDVSLSNTWNPKASLVWSVFSSILIPSPFLQPSYTLGCIFLGRTPIKFKSSLAFPVCFGDTVCAASSESRNTSASKETPPHFCLTTAQTPELSSVKTQTNPQIHPQLLQDELLRSGVAPCCINTSTRSAKFNVLGILFSPPFTQCWLRV